MLFTIPSTGDQFREIMRELQSTTLPHSDGALSQEESDRIHRGWIEQEEKELLVESMIKFL